MDMNMPILDGFEATRALVKARISSPVIALTAMALAGDEERCRAAGCAAFVGKPIVPSLFFETLARHVRAPAEAAPERELEGTLLSMAKHPRFRGLVERYVGSFPELVARLRQHEQRGDLEEVRTLVHRLRGTAASYGFPAVSQAARPALELEPRARDRDPAERSAAELVTDAPRLRVAGLAPGWTRCGKPSR